MPLQRFSAERLGSRVLADGAAPRGRLALASASRRRMTSSLTSSASRSASLLASSEDLLGSPCGLQGGPDVLAGCVSRPAGATSGVGMVRDRARLRLMSAAQVVCLAAAAAVGVRVPVAQLGVGR